jgi:hypothetical protein
MLAQKAKEISNRKIPIKFIVVGIQGQILEDSFL